MQHLRIILIFGTIILLRHLCNAQLGPFLSKEKAASYLQGQSKRVKRGINEECAEAKGCSYEEIREIGVTDVCAWMKSRLCSQLYCSSEYVCVTTNENCSNLNYYRVGCQAILCPVLVGNAVLSSTCSRKIGVSCSFSCLQGYNSTTLDNIVCTSDGTWSLNTTTLCSPILCPKSVGNAIISPNCSRMIGKACTYSCTHGYFPTTSDSVVCTSEGSWNMDIMDNNALCSLLHCPLDVINGNTSSSCRGLIGEKCYVICDNSVNTVNIVCLSSGSWDKDTTAICSLKNESVIHCPLDVINGNISSSCRGLIGEKCNVICDNSVNTVNIVCLSSGSWDKDTTAICRLKNESESSSLEASRANMTFLYAGTSVAGTLVVVIIIAGVACLIKRRDDKTRNVNQGMPSNTENRAYFESVNSAYEEPNEHVYCEI